MSFVSDIPIYKVPLVPRLLAMPKLLKIPHSGSNRRAFSPTCGIKQTSSNSATYLPPQPAAPLGHYFNRHDLFFDGRLDKKDLDE